MYESEWFAGLVVEKMDEKFKINFMKKKRSQPELTFNGPPKIHLVSERNLHPKKFGSSHLIHMAEFGT